MKEILKKSGQSILLGNEAIVRGSLEAGVQFVTTYPGTPASEIGNVFSKIAKQQGVYFEFSTNEKLALEAGIGASFSGLKTLVAMKNFGLNVCSDALLPFLYTGSKGPFVLVVADDPSCHSSAQSEENSRGFSYLAHIPTLEPSNPKECKEFIKEAFKISAKFELPVMVRLTTRVAHQRMPVPLSLIKKTNFKGKFVKDRNRFVTMPPRVLEMKEELLNKIKRMKEFAEKSELNLLEGKGKKGIITSGVSYLYVKEVLKEIGLDLPVLKIGIFYPLAEQKIKKFLKNLDSVLIVEELDNYLEKEVRSIDCNIKILSVKEVGELSFEDVTEGVMKLLGKRYNKKKEFAIKKVKHLPRFCIGWPTCPYWKLFSAVKQVAPKNTIFGGDIGCYMMASLPPHNLYDYLSCMGSGVGIAHGIKKATNQKIIAFIGDGTFFHSGIPALLNASYNKSNPLIIILDNRITAMTGQQPNPGMGKTGTEESPQIKIEDLLKAMQIKNVRVLDQEQEYKELVETIKDFLNKKEMSVIIARRVCGLYHRRQMKK